MTKVEELRDSWYGCLTSEFRGLLQGVHNDLDSLLNTVDADAFARGVAAGAEQERERIREASSYMAEGTQADCDQLYVHKEYHQGTEYHVILVGGDFYMVDPLELAPKEKAKHHATESELMESGMCTAEDLKAMALDDVDPSVLAPTKEVAG